MFPVMSSASKANGYLFVIVIALVFCISIPSATRFLKNNDETFSLFLNGDLSRLFESHFDQEFVLRDAAISTWADIQYLLFDEASTGAILGDQGWIFTNEEYLFPSAYEQTLEVHLTKFEQIRSAIEAQGKRLIIVPIPMKLDIYQEYSRIDMGHKPQQLYQDLLEQLHARQFSVADTRTSIIQGKSKGDVFVPTDTHWTALGAKTTAETIANQFPSLIGDTEFVVSQTGEKSYSGDLLNFLRFHPSLAPQYFSDYKIPVYQAFAKTPLAEISQMDALFGDKSISIALIGTSYSKFEEWNFLGFLQKSLNSEIASMTFAGVGPYAAMEEFLKDNLLKDTAIETVIWEYPVRTLMHQNKQRDIWQGNIDKLFEI